eukprot:CAMPEP_0113312364 /NCGR_PEP_ID=MMETSP0010_2-20120614/9229_1 /TAXON_ID=216773 ORGANISM="Corethron hystrix, Strain 308" /NCGR_SAMPLE_ID=MMETSP0010_2 /ASSEMBLY_ACC=CAM_ASM_000155 /LENGTH=1212 /DNA_ID=CAMNT_0000168185 /DNA_START=643 /DNA_END=4278 /DNA_ORIENTATION=- /assembly_acc=CAM_ASM_000155
MPRASSGDGVILPMMTSSREYLTNAPLSKKYPPSLGFPSFERSYQTSPGVVFGKNRKTITENSGILPKPTNIWYQNLLLGGAGSNPTVANNAYTLPYIVDAVGPITGLRLHWPFMLGSSVGVEEIYREKYALTLGSADASLNHAYHAVACDKGFGPFGVTLRWGEEMEPSGGYMMSPITRGMPFGTMKYYGGIRPSVASAIVPSSNPILDGSQSLKCGSMHANNDTSTNYLGAQKKIAKKFVSLHFGKSDFSWIVTFSRPVLLECYFNEDNIGKQPQPPPPPGVIISGVSNVFQLRVVNETVAENLVVRVALVNDCTSHKSATRHCQAEHSFGDDYSSLLIDHADLYAECPDVYYSFPSSHNNSDISEMHFDWDVHSTTASDTLSHSTGESSDLDANVLDLPPSGRRNLDLSSPSSGTQSKQLLVYALSNHITNMVSPTKKTRHCVKTLRGKMCLVVGNRWTISEDLGDPITFNGKIPPRHWAIPALSHSLSRDITFKLPENYMKGAGDTYFSGKMLAKQARILLVADELRSYARTTPESETENDDIRQTIEACQNASLPTDNEFEAAIERLKEGVEIWLNGTAQAIFTYDEKWGGVVSCGCKFHVETTSCYNSFPNCPTFSDPGMDFGHGFYNDHHFHHGYHVYAAAVVSKYDEEWGRKYFENVLLLIRDFANPSPHDPFFPRFRMKDMFLGLSFASGIATLGGQPYFNGRNQESSSEAIAAYEAMALYGNVMMECWKQTDNYQKSQAVSQLGRLLTVMEVKAADRYYHVKKNELGKNDNIYPSEYAKPVVGILWQQMVQFQTWFGNAPYLAIGIQLMPLTAISVRRDDPKWASSLYPTFQSSCENDSVCTSQGWSILLYAILATIGKPEDAMAQVLELPGSVFNTPGGNGHSLSNTLWYISTRPEYHFSAVVQPEQPNKTNKKDGSEPNNLCSPSVCSESLQSCPIKDAPYYCIDGQNMGGCSNKPWNAVTCQNSCMLKIGCADVDVPDQICSPSTCNSYFDRCPIQDAPYLCFSGTNAGGCSVDPWSSDACENSCKLTAECLDVNPLDPETITNNTDDADVLMSSSNQVENKDADEPSQICSSSICRKSLNSCPILDAPYVCYGGRNSGGCATEPWSAADCESSCKLIAGCPDEAPDEDRNHVGNADDLIAISNHHAESAQEMTINFGDCEYCPEEVCSDNTLNLCPLHDAPFVCLAGNAKSGCSEKPW